MGEIVNRIYSPCIEINRFMVDNLTGHTENIEKSIQVKLKYE